ncbi:MAG: hypothetical protein ACTSX8_05835, partial [Alphaproteobacteria bacterium]
MPIRTETILFKLLGDSRGAIKAFDKLNKRLLALGAGLTAAGDAALVTFAKFGEAGARLEALEGRFEHMAAAFGRTAESMLAEWSKAAEGTVSRAE